MRKGLIVVFVFLSSVLLAQPGDPDGDPDAPLGGIEFLMIAGALLGAKKAIEKKNKQY